MIWFATEDEQPTEHKCIPDWSKVGWEPDSTFKLHAGNCRRTAPCRTCGKKLLLAWAPIDTLI